MAVAGAATKASAVAARIVPRRSVVRMPGFMPSPLEEMRPAVDHDGLAGDELAGVAGEIKDGAGKVLAREIALQGLIVADRLHALLVFGAEELLGALGQDRRGGDG